MLKVADYVFVIGHFCYSELSCMIRTFFAAIATLLLLSKAMVIVVQSLDALPTCFPNYSARFYNAPSPLLS